MNYNVKLQKKTTRGIELDLSNSKQVSIITNLFGGEERMKKEYPEHYRLMKESSKTPADEEYNTLGVQNSAHVENIFFEKETKRAYTVGWIYLTEKVQNLNCFLEIYRDGELIGREAKVFSDTDNAKIECYSDPLSISETTNFKAQLIAFWHSDESDKIRSLMDSIITDEMVGIGDEFVTELEIDDPAYKKQRAQQTDIKVALNRKDNTVDYDYESGTDAKRNVRMFLDIAGKAVLMEQHKFSSLSDIDITLNMPGYGTIFYLNSIENNQIIVSDDKKNIHWQLDNDWKNIIPGSANGGKIRSSFDMKICYNCICGRKHRIIVSSEDYPPYKDYKFYKQIPYINILWGCLGEGTLISMKDGTKKPIEKIVIGDTLITDNGSTTTVTNVVTGIENKIHHLKLESGEEILATSTHVFVSKKGLIQVANICSTTELLKEDGTFSHVLYCYEDDYARTVYSIDTEMGKLFFANGIASGTHMDQGRIVHEDRNHSLRFNPLLDAEIKKLLNDYAEGRL